MWKSDPPFSSGLPNYGLTCQRLWWHGDPLEAMSKSSLNHWPFQVPKLEVPIIYKAYFSGLCKGISPENMALYGTIPPSVGSWNSHWLKQISVLGHLRSRCQRHQAEVWESWCKEFGEHISIVEVGYRNGLFIGRSPRIVQETFFGIFHGILMEYEWEIHWNKFLIHQISRRVFPMKMAIGIW